MSTGPWSRLEGLFHQAVDLSPAARRAFVDQVCAGDPELRSELESLLSADVPEDGLLEAAVAQAVDGLPLDQGHDSEFIGKRLGHYTITSMIGKGGMGAVYRALREEDFRMQVAIKLLKRGTDTEAALRRFRIERQILAGLQHPNIAHLLDGGATEHGLPYLVMEYIEGRPLLDYAATLSIRQRLELFRTVCSAAEYAHQKKVVHRDIKPANILVTAEAIPKLLDFGIAKLLDPGTEGGLTATGIAGRLMTPDYASPEQVRGEPVTTATDVYSLGAVLYELVTGQRPHHLETYSPTEIEQEICANEPKKPSAVNQDLDPDLDNIILMAMRKEPARRYASAQELSDDLDRYLKDEPVAARAESLAYRGRKFLRRNRIAISAAVLSALTVLALAFGVSRSHETGFVERASIAVLPFTDKSPAAGASQLADDLMSGLLDILTGIPELRVAGAQSIAVLSRQFEQESKDVRFIGKKLNVESILKASVASQGSRAIIQVQLLKASDGTSLWSAVYDRPVNHAYTVEQEIMKGITSALRLKPPKPGVQPATMVTSPEAYKYYLQGEYFRGNGDIEKAIHYFELTVQADPNYAPVWVALGDAHANLAGASKTPPAEGYRKAREEIERALSLNPDLAEAHALVGQIKMLHEWDWAGADASIQRALALAPGNAGVLRIAGLLYRSQGRLDEAIQQYRRGMELEPIYSNGYKNFGITLYYAGKQEEAAAALDKALELNPRIAYAHGYRALVHLAQLHPQEGLAEAKEEKSPFRLCVMAIAYHTLGRKGESNSYLTAIIANHSADFTYQIAQVYAFRGEIEEAFKWLDRSYAQRDDSLPEMKSDPLLANLRSDPRYTTLLKKIHLL